SASTPPWCGGATDDRRNGTTPGGPWSTRTSWRGSSVTGDKHVRVVFVCTGNICRSPMAESMARRALDDAGLGEQVTASSAGTQGWHAGNGMDPRAASELEAHGFDTAHIAARLSEPAHGADLVVALDSGHRSHLIAAGDDDERARMLRAYDSDAAGADVADLYYGGARGFSRPRIQIGAALLGRLAEVRDRLR